MFDSAEKRALKQQIQTLNSHLQANQNRVDHAILAYKVAQSPKWEYVIDEEVSPQKLVQYGQEGWELASAFGYRSSNTPAILGEHAYFNIRYIFKRKLVDVPDTVAAQIYQPHETQAIEDEIKGLQARLDALR